MIKSIGAGPSLLALRCQTPGGQKTGLNLTDRGKSASRGIPLVVPVSGTKRHGAMMFERCRDAIPGVACLQGPARKRPAKSHADKGYNYKRSLANQRQRGISNRLVRRGLESSKRLGKHCWVMEITLGWFAGFGKLRIRFERHLNIHKAFLNWQPRSSARAS